MSRMTQWFTSLCSHLQKERERHSPGLTNMILETHYLHYYMLCEALWHSIMRVVSGSHDPVFPRSRGIPNHLQCRCCKLTLIPLRLLSDNACGSRSTCLVPKKFSSPRALPVLIYTSYKRSCNVMGLCHSCTCLL